MQLVSSLISYILLSTPIYRFMGLQPFVGPWPVIRFCNLFYTVGRTPWTGDKTVARPLLAQRRAQTQNKRI
jgi:hypothetical protein